MEQENLILPDGLFHIHSPALPWREKSGENLILEKRLHFEGSIWRLKSFGSQDKLMQLFLGVEIFFFPLYRGG